MQTIDPPLADRQRSGQVTMNGKDWLWVETTSKTTGDLFGFSIAVINKETQQTVFIREGYIAKQ
jgi:hypothetical protein